MAETWQGRNEVAIPADGQEGSLHIFAFIYIYRNLMKRRHLDEKNTPLSKSRPGENPKHEVSQLSNNYHVVRKPCRTCTPQI